MVLSSPWTVFLKLSIYFAISTTALPETEFTNSLLEKTFTSIFVYTSLRRNAFQSLGLCICSLLPYMEYALYIPLLHLSSLWCVSSASSRPYRKCRTSHSVLSLKPFFLVSSNELSTVRKTAVVFQQGFICPYWFSRSAFAKESQTLTPTGMRIFQMKQQNI